MTDVNVLIPVQTLNLSSGATVAEIAAGENHSLAMKKDGTLFSWGNNESGQLGDGTMPTVQETPVQIGGTGDW